ncbi:terminase large subunit [Candidatus Contubernalis alkaliaceticus]|uniref:terminase large subunit n=1 Tax=Candidatus Contubernalis alkaliaceticus TaxID=338645 RepID=UPI001F4C2DCF|nr:terminase large subunit [Candidatus Contubernalis alkalaceticus]UNC91688.1 terminase large subunit [Candidatus Contubernalis alkalaceticus]
MTTSKTSKLQTTQYAKDVVAGRLTACRKVQLACKRHLKDLARQGTKDFPYVFDEERAYRPIEFIEKFCKPSQGDFEKLDLQPWQHFIIGSLYGWIHKKTKLRRFREGLIFVARKQGKTAKVSGLSLYGASKDGERGARIYPLANAMKQARLTFDECKAMVKESPVLKKHFRALRDAIYFDKTNSKIEPQASDSEKLDGLNCHLGIFDEIHEYKNYKLINVIKNSSGARRQPLFLYITTAGYQLDGPLMDYYEKGADVLEGVIQDERSFYYMAELDEDDEVDDPSTWIKSNPNLGVTVLLEDMIEEWESRKHIPAEKNDFITKRLNIFVQSDEQSFIDLEVIKRNSDYIDPETLTGANCIGGFDLSSTEDFTSSCLEFPLEDGRVKIISHSFVPMRKVLMDNEKLPFREWEEAGLLTICPGDYVDYSYVYDWFIKMSKIYSIMLITYDPANAYRLVQDLQAYGGEEWTKVVRQGATTLSPALKDIKEMLLDGKAVFNRNKLFRWYLNNIRLVKDRNNNWLPTKQNRYRKIDGFAAWLNAHTETMKLMAAPKETGGVGFVSVKDLLGR